MIPDNSIPSLSPTNQVDPGKVVSFTPKNPFQSTSIWGLIVLLITAAVRKYLPQEYQSAGLNAALEALQYLVGAGMILWGRWTAHRPLGFSDSTVQTVKSLFLPFASVLIPATLIATLCTSTVGCSLFNPSQVSSNSTSADPLAEKSLIEARIAFAGVLHAINDLVAEGSMTGADKANLAPYVHSAANALNLWQAAISIKSPVQAQNAQTTFNQQMTVLSSAQTSATARKEFPDVLNTVPVVPGAHSTTNPSTNAR